MNQGRPSREAVLPRHMVDKMRNWEYVNFNELIPICDPSVEEDTDWQQASDHFALFPGVGLVCPGYNIKYSFLQWANYFEVYIAVTVMTLAFA